MKTRFFALLSAVFLANTPIFAQTGAPLPEELRQALQKSVDTHPLIQERWHAFRATENLQDVARGNYLPSIDLQANAGRERLKYPGLSSDSFNRRGAIISLNQMLYDGLFTPSEVARLGHTKLMRYFDLLDVTENISLETFQAYADVLRYRELVQEAQQNYVEHKLIYDRIVDRTRAGISRGVDLEQATGRLALAESNLLTEVANLHDVSARYVRLVGTQPAAELEPLDTALFTGYVPLSKTEALNIAFTENPGLKMTQANVRAGQSTVKAVRSAFQPRFDIRASQGAERNRDGDRGTTREGIVELVMTYNLYRGGADKARLRAAAEDLNVARDLRENSCRDLRQTVSIAYNDIQQLTEQLEYLDVHRLSTDKARQAYRQQFEIGQRSLLDLLDTENEYFEASRAYTNAIYNKMIAEARSLDGMGQLLRVLGIMRADLPAVSALAAETDYVDPESLCPLEAPEMLEIDKRALFEEALQVYGSDRQRQRP